MPLTALAPAAVAETTFPNAGIAPTTSSPREIAPCAIAAPQPAGRGFIIVAGTQIPVVELHDTFPLFAATAGSDTVFPLHFGNPNASVELDHSMP